MNNKTREALAGMLAIVDESRGVDGYHLNGDTAEWDEFPEVEAARAALAQQPECGCCGQTGPCDPDCDCAEQPDAWTPSGADYDRNTHRNPDAAAWADLFVATFPGLADKHDLMLGWFANAMMAMHDFLKAEQPDTVKVPRVLLADMCSLDHDTRIQAERRLLALLAGGAE